MLIALLDKTDRVEAEYAEKGLDYSCPVCRNSVILKQGEIKIWHFAHKYLGDCWWIGESKEHLEAKIALKAIFSKYYKTKLEVFVGTNIIDLLLDDRFAIEVQCSQISPVELLARTGSLNKKGYAVLWILAGKNLINLFKEIDEFDARTRKFIYYLHSKMYFGRFYAYDNNKIYAVYPYYRTKTLIKSFKLIEIKNFKLAFQRVFDGQYEIARFYDKYEK